MLGDVTLANTASLCAIGLAAVSVVRWWTGARRGKLPPGPPGEFLVGHLRVVPKDDTAEAYAQWGMEYDSDVIYVNSLGQPIVVLNSAEAARDLLEKRGGNYCSRPRFTLLEVMGWGRTISFMPFGPSWKLHRREVQGYLRNSDEWKELQVREARRTATSIVANPDDFRSSIRRFAVAISLKVSYGVDVITQDDPYNQIAKDAMYAIGNGGLPANSIVDVFPPARYLPDWLVRDRALAFARKWAWAIRRLHDTPFDETKSEIYRDSEKSDSERTSFAHTYLADYRDREKYGADQQWTLDDIKGAAGAIFIAGTDTTWATIVIFILNMVLHPDIQSGAQQELDYLLQRQRLPTFEDRPALPSIERIIQEVYRWSPLAPLGIPHKSIEDDTYKGMLIPKGKPGKRNTHPSSSGSIGLGLGYSHSSKPPTSSIVYSNVHAITHDTRVYTNPAEFNPQRYAPPEHGGLGEPDPVGNFGFGRRVCPGQKLAHNSVWIMAATLLAVFSFERKVVDGRVIEPIVRFTNGGTCSPEDFECAIIPRSEAARNLLMSSMNDA